MSEIESGKERQEDRARETLYKKIDEELKILADLKRYTFTAFIAVVVGAFNADEKFSVYAGIIGILILLTVFFVLVVLRYRKIKSYEDD